VDWENSSLHTEFNEIVIQRPPRMALGAPEGYTRMLRDDELNNNRKMSQTLRRCRCEARCSLLFALRKPIYISFFFFLDLPWSMDKSDNAVFVQAIPFRNSSQSETLLRMYIKIG
jgi:hypothetical protein